LIQILARSRTLSPSPLTRRPIYPSPVPRSRLGRFSSTQYENHVVEALDMRHGQMV
jgi:hypothetical protein